MTDKKEHTPAKDAEAKTITVYNRGPRTFSTSAGPLGADKSITLPEAEAKQILDYKEVSDIAKMSPRGANHDAELKALKKTHADVVAELAETKKGLESAHETIAGLKADLEDAKEAKKHKGK